MRPAVGLGRRRRRRRDECGVATVIGLGFVGLVLAVSMVAVGIGSVVVTHRRAESAADLAALAAASGHQRGLSPCVEARRVALANHAAVVGCRLDGAVVTVVVECPGPVGLPLPSRARARAGPAGPA